MLFKKSFFNGLKNTNVRYFSGDIKTIKERMGAVDSIKKITEAMKMVASSKMKSEMNRLINGRDFGVNTIPKIMSMDSYLAKKAQDVVPKKTLIIPITSDGGLCGSINSGIIRELKKIVPMEDKHKYEILPIGEKGTSGLIRQYGDIISKSITDLPKPINFYAASSIANLIDTNENEVDNILILYNEFKNAISFKIKYLDLMSRKSFLKKFKYLTRYEATEPDKDCSINYLYELYLSSTIYHCLLQNSACEQSSRINAMENASKNAKDMLGELTLKYNKARQAKITMELCEIISGASAI